MPFLGAYLLFLAPILVFLRVIVLDLTFSLVFIFLGMENKNTKLKNLKET